MFKTYLWDIQKNIEDDVKEALNIEEINVVKKRNNQRSLP